MLMSLITIASASTYEVFKAGDTIDLKGSCIIAGDYCDNTAECYLTVNYPNGDLLVNNVLMTNNDNYHNYTLPNTLVTGVYTTLQKCCEGAFCGTTDDIFEISSTGVQQRAVGTNTTLIVLGILSCIVIGIGFYLNNPYFGFIGGILMMLLGVYTMIYGFNNTTDIYTRGVAGVLIGLGLFFSIVAAYEWAVGDRGESED